MHNTVSSVPAGIASGLSINALLSVYTTYKEHEVAQEAAVRAQRVRDRAFALQREAVADERRQNQRDFELALRRQDTLDGFAEQELDLRRDRIAADLEVARLGAASAKRGAKFGIASTIIRGVAAYYTGGASEAARQT